MESRCDDRVLDSLSRIISRSADGNRYLAEVGTTVKILVYGTPEADEHFAKIAAEQKACHEDGGHDFEWGVEYTSWPPCYRCKKCKHLMGAREILALGITPQRWNRKESKWEDDPEDYKPKPVHPDGHLLVLDLEDIEIINSAREFCFVTKIKIGKSMREGA